MCQYIVCLGSLLTFYIFPFHFVHLAMSSYKELFSQINPDETSAIENIIDAYVTLLGHVSKVKLVRTRGTGPQLRAHIGGRTRRRRPNLWPYGWSILVIGLDIKQARTFID